jgi:hypothetical protein
MSLLTVILVIVVVGVVLWAINTYLPMAAPIKNILNIVVICVLIVWLMKAFGLWTALSRVHL